MDAAVMLAASFDLVKEGQEHGSGNLVVTGILAGALFIWLCKQQYVEVSMLDIKGADAAKVVLVIGTLLSFGEGSGVGVSFAGSNGFNQGLLVTLAIAVHNIPEGLAVSMVLASRGVSPQNAMLWSIITSLPQEKELLSKVCNLLTIGPTIPSMYLDQRIKSDTDYDLKLFDSKDSAFCISWLNTRPQGSVVYVAFGSIAKLNNVQMEELASAVSNFSFLWVVRDSEEENLPLGFLETVDKKKSMVLKWSPQLEVLSNKAIGCFLTHCGWNSTMEALTFGVPMVAMPQWTDQPMNAKYIQDVWKVGVTVKTDNESGVAKREEIEFAIKEVMEGEKSQEMKECAKKWRDLAVKSLSEGGSTDINIDTFVSKVQRK